VFAYEAGCGGEGALLIKDEILQNGKFRKRGEKEEREEAKEGVRQPREFRKGGHPGGGGKKKYDRKRGTRCRENRKKKRTKGPRKVKGIGACTLQEKGEKGMSGTKEQLLSGPIQRKLKRAEGKRETNTVKAP